MLRVLRKENKYTKEEKERDRYKDGAKKHPLFTKKRKKKCPGVKHTNQRSGGRKEEEEEEEEFYFESHFPFLLHLLSASSLCFLVFCVLCLCLFTRRRPLSSLLSRLTSSHIFPACTDAHLLPPLSPSSVCNRMFSSVPCLSAVAVVVVGSEKRSRFLFSST